MPQESNHQQLERVALVYPQGQNQYQLHADRVKNEGDDPRQGLVHSVFEDEADETVAVEKDIWQFEPFLYEFLDSNCIPPVNVELAVGISGQLRERVGHGLEKQVNIEQKHAYGEELYIQVEIECGRVETQRVQNFPKWGRNRAIDTFIQRWNRCIQPMGGIKVSLQVTDVIEVPPEILVVQNWLEALCNHYIL